MEESSILLAGCKIVTVHFCFGFAHFNVQNQNKNASRFQRNAQYYWKNMQEMKYSTCY